MEYEVAKLEGPRLNQAVAKAECVAAVVESYMTNPPKPAACWLKVHGQPDFNRGPYEPSTKWSTGGPIIERERITIQPSGLLGPDGKIQDGYMDEGDRWYACMPADVEGPRHMAVPEQDAADCSHALLRRQQVRQNRGIALKHLASCGSVRPLPRGPEENAGATKRKG